jgi:hypothetical protein
MQQTTAIPERTIAVATLACLSAGLVAGIGARIIMRIVALTSHMPPQFSIEGTFNILFTGIASGFVVGFIITILTIALSASRKASKYLPGPIWRGLIWGLLILLIFGPPLFLSSSFPNPDISFGIPLLNKSMFGALILIYGITLGVAEKVFDRYLPRRPTSARADIPTSIPSEES